MTLLDRVSEKRAKVIAADLAHLQEARDWAQRAAYEAGLGDADRYQIKLAMSEAVANAIQHGSRSASDRIRLSSFRRDGSLVFEVRDSGRFVAPLARPTPDDESGRGLELLELTMDEVRIESVEDGSLLRFAKRLL